MGSGSLFSYVALFALGIPYVLSNELSIGDFVAAGSAYLLQGPLLELGFIISDYRKGSTSLKRLLKIYDRASEDFLVRDGQLESRDPKNGEKLISVKDLSFQFETADQPLFSHLTFDLAAGERLGIKAYWCWEISSDADTCGS